MPGHDIIVAGASGGGVDATIQLVGDLPAEFKENAIAIVLSGTGSDCVLGVQAIHKMGGKVIVQEESTCEFSEMPNAAIQTGKVDLILSPNAIASTLVNLVMSVNSN